MSEHSADQAATPESVPTRCDPTCNAFTQDQHIEVATRDTLPIRHVRCIGRGSSAIIEMVAHKLTNELFALKAFQRYHARHFANDKRAFENEVSIMKRLSSHPHIIKVRGSYICERELGILMSPVASEGDLGAYLAKVFESGKTNEQDAVLNRAFGCLTNGLAYIHKHTIRHKDIKPQNILIHNGRVIYTDFGISFDADQQDTTTIGYADAFTRRYCAPEVQEYTSRNRKSDVFSLGCVFVEILDALEPKIGLRSMDRLPYSEKLHKVRQLLVQSCVTDRVRKELLRICYNMLEPSLADRIDTGSVLSRIAGLGNAKGNLTTRIFCDDCSEIVESNSTVNQEELVDVCTELSLETKPTADDASSGAEMKSATKRATKKRKNKGIVSSTEFGEGNEPTTSHKVSSVGNPRYYCTACGELGHKSSRCPNECWACGELYHKSADCPNKCWTCDSVGHYARNCPNECDACGEIGHPTDDCPNRCWTCGEVGHFARNCQDECFVCGKLGHKTQDCKGKCHKCGNIGHWRIDCDEACVICGELGHEENRCPSKKKKKGRSGDGCYECGDLDHWAAQCPIKQQAWRPIFDQVPQGPYRLNSRRRN